MEETREILSVAEAAEYLGFDNETIYRKLNKGKLPGIKMGKEWRLKKSELDKMFQTEVQNEKA